MNIAKKLTAAQIGSARNLAVHPHGPRLIAIGKEIEARAAKADGYHVRATDMVDSIKTLLVEAKGYCANAGGFNAFRKKHCPSLGRSRAYEILSIAAGRKTAAQVNAAKVVRQTRYVARLKAAAGAMRRAGRPEDRSSVSHTGSSPRPSIDGLASPLRPSRDGSNALPEFTKRVLELVLMTATAEPKAFNSAKLETDDLRKLADFLIDVADLRKTKLRIVK